MSKKFIISSLFIFTFSFLILFSLFNLQPASAATICTNLNSNIAIGSKDGHYRTPYVTALQNFLVTKGLLTTAPNGYFGFQTQAAVRSFQQANGLEVTGFVGPLTREKIKTLSCGLNTASGVTVPAAPIAIANSPVLATTTQPSVSICQFVELLITIGVISPEKAPIARIALSCSANTNALSVATTTVTTTAPAVTRSSGGGGGGGGGGGSSSSQTYTVTYNANGATSGSAPSDSTRYARNATVTVLGNTGALTKTGYIFSGWNTSANGSGTTHAVSSTFSVGSANVTLYAVWELDDTISPPFVWVPSHNSDGIVLKIDSSTGRYNSLNLGNHSFDSLAIDADGNVWVVSFQYSMISKIDNSTNENTHYSLSSKPTGIAADDRGNLWIVQNEGTISKFDISRGLIIGTYDVGRYPLGVAVDSNGNVWVTNEGDDNVSKLKVSTGDLVDTYSVGTDPTGIAIDADGNVWISNYEDNTVTKLNGSTGVQIGTYAVGNNPYGIAVDSDANVWVVNSGSNNLSKLSVSTGDLMGTYSVGYLPSAVAVDVNGNIWVVNEGTSDGTISKLNGSTGNLIGTYYAGQSPWFLGDFTGFVLNYFVLKGGESISVKLVTYNANLANAGTVPVDSGTYIPGDLVTTKDNTGSLTKNGYTFTGWNTASDGGGTAYATSSVLTVGDSNVILYAQWTALPTHLITFEPNGGAGASTTQEIIENTSANLATSTFTREGYTFAGWATSTDGEVAYSDGESFSMGTEDVILYAKWTENIVYNKVRDFFLALLVNSGKQTDSVLFS